ncbi:MAG: aspartate/glutamate racemase family protein [Marinovum sp.]|nr:aspartate/glutamate racemase family protein [Marinovum sp.]
MSLSYDLIEPDMPGLGLIVLRVDETIEDEFRRHFSPDQVRLHISRVQSGDDLTPETITQMGPRLQDAAALLPRAAQFDVVGYACTSATASLGADYVAQAVRGGVPCKEVTDPLSSALAYAKAHDLKRMAIVSPYEPHVAAPLLSAFERGGVEVVDSLSFGEKSEACVARIASTSIADAARHLVSRCHTDGLFLSCTNLKTFSLRPSLEQELGVPVLSSNHALAWHMAQLAGL